MCGAPVRVTRRRSGERSLSGEADMVEIRTCTRASCDSNTGEKRIGDSV